MLLFKENVYDINWGELDEKIKQIETKKFFLFLFWSNYNAVPLNVLKIIIDNIVQIHNVAHFIFDMSCARCMV